MIKLELTEREFECLLGHMKVDEDIWKELKESEGTDDPNEYTNVMLSLVERFEEIKLNKEESNK